MNVYILSTTEDVDVDYMLTTQILILMFNSFSSSASLQYVNIHCIFMLLAGECWEGGDESEGKARAIKAVIKAFLFRF